MSSCCRKAGKCSQVLGVGQYRMGGMIQKIDMPHPDQCGQIGMLRSQRGGAEMLVHVMRAGEQSSNCSKPMASAIGRPMADHSE